MKQFISAIQNDVQEKNSLVWKKLCDYLDERPKMLGAKIKIGSKLSAASKNFGTNRTSFESTSHALQ